MAKFAYIFTRNALRAREVSEVIGGLWLDLKNADEFNGGAQIWLKQGKGAVPQGLLENSPAF
jgi:hypothetical protein